MKGGSRDGPTKKGPRREPAGDLKNLDSLMALETPIFSTFRLLALFTKNGIENWKRKFTSSFAVMGQQ